MWSAPARLLGARIFRSDLEALKMSDPPKINPRNRLTFNPEVMWSLQRTGRALGISELQLWKARRRLAIIPLRLTPRARRDPRIALGLDDIGRIAVSLFGPKAGASLCRIHGIPIPQPIRDYSAPQSSDNWPAVPC